jgi:hypothetical protein
MSKLTDREKKLLLGCILVLVTMVCVIMLKTYLDSKQALEAKIAALTIQKDENTRWLSDAAFQQKRSDWLKTTLTSTESVGRAQGQLQEEVDQALQNLEIKNMRAPDLVQNEKTAHYDEVAVRYTLRGELNVVLAWLASLQSPERFIVIKALEIEPDARAKEKTPHVFVNLTIARWFKPSA